METPLLRYVSRDLGLLCVLSLGGNTTIRWIDLNPYLRDLRNDLFCLATVVNYLFVYL
jgi:hypothetical protein